MQIKSIFTALLIGSALAVPIQPQVPKDSLVDTSTVDLESSNNLDLKVTVHTSDRFLAGTDAQVQVGFQLRNGRGTPGYNLDGPDSHFERGSTDTYNVHPDFDWSFLEGICVGVTNSDGAGDAWHAGWIEVVNPTVTTGIYGYKMKVDAWLEDESDSGYPKATCCGRKIAQQAECEVLRR
jgi:hypothetical protein